MLSLFGLWVSRSFPSQEFLYKGDRAFKLLQLISNPHIGTLLALVRRLPIVWISSRLMQGADGIYRLVERSLGKGRPPVLFQKANVPGDARAEFNAALDMRGLAVE